MNTTAKANRSVYKARDLLYSLGAFGVSKPSASLGVYDLIALMPFGAYGVQVKTNAWPSSDEMIKMAKSPHPKYLQKLVFMYRDRVKDPEIKVLHREGEELICEIRDNELFVILTAKGDEEE